MNKNGKTYFFAKVIFFIITDIWTWTGPVAVSNKQQGGICHVCDIPISHLDRAIQVLFYGGIKPCGFPKLCIFF